MKPLKKIINIVCTTIATTFAAFSLILLGYVFYSASVKRAAEIGLAAMAYEGLKAVGVFGVLIAGIFIAVYVWDWSGEE